MEVSVGQAAEALGVTSRRVHALIAAGRIRARKVSGVWLVDGASLPATARRGRPMTPAGAWALLLNAAPATPQDAYRRRQRLARLAADPEPENLLASWVASRGRRELYSSNTPAGVRDDQRVVATGVSDPRAGIGAAGIAEGWVTEADLRAVTRAHLLRTADSAAAATVVLHVAAALPARPVPLLLLAADLADWEKPRELSAARRLVNAALL